MSEIRCFEDNNIMKLYSNFPLWIDTVHSCWYLFCLRFKGGIKHLHKPLSIIIQIILIFKYNGTHNLDVKETLSDKF